MDVRGQDYRHPIMVEVRLVSFIVQSIFNVLQLPGACQGKATLGVEFDVDIIPERWHPIALDYTHSFGSGYT